MQKKQRVCVNNIFSADKSGCYYYRLRFPAAMCECKCADVLRMNYLDIYNVDNRFFKYTNCNILQRQISDVQRRYFLEYIVPMSKITHSWVIYSIDDPLCGDDIPRYNQAWDQYQNKDEQDNIKKMLLASDFVLVTTQELAMYYHEKFSVPRENLLFVQNYLPKHLFGGWYNEDEIIRNYEANKAKPRVGIIGSPSHFNVKNVLGDNGKPIDDDFSGIAEYVRKTVDKYQWVVFATKIPAILDLIESGKVEYHDGTDMLSYAGAVASLGLQAIVSPLQDNTFNRCKSNLKVIEPWALGVVPVVQELPNYARYTKSTFKNADELDARLSTSLGDAVTFMKTVKENHAAVEPWWLENHFRDWLDIFMIRHKNEIVSYDRMKEEEEKRKRVAQIEAEANEAKEVK